MRRLLLAIAAAVLASSTTLGAQAGDKPPAKKPAPAKEPAGPGAPGSLTNFSGIWQLDVNSSSGGSPNLKDAMLEVTQKGDRIWIQPLMTRMSRLSTGVTPIGPDRWSRTCWRYLTS